MHWWIGEMDGMVGYEDRSAQWSSAGSRTGELRRDAGLVDWGLVDLVEVMQLKAWLARGLGRQQRLGVGKSKAKRETQVEGRRRQWLFRAVPLVVLVALPWLVEGGLRVAGFGAPTDFLIRKGGHWAPNEQFAAQFFGPSAVSRPVYFKLAAQKPADTVRIVVLGESAAMGTPDPAFSFGRILEVMLEGDIPGKRVELVNAAMRGIDSHVVRRIAKDCAKLKPDVFIVYMGNNEVVGLHGPEPGCSRLSQALWVMRAGQWVKSTRLWQLAMKMGRGDAHPPQKQDMEFFRQHRLAPDDWRRETVRRNFAANLEDVCRAGMKAGVKVIVCTVPVNVKDFPPLGSPGEKWDANAAFRLGQRLFEAGETNEARQHFERALDWDALQFRADSKLNDEIRRIVQEMEHRSLVNARLIDAVKVFAEADGGTPGARLFRDHVHPTFEGDYLLAEAISHAVVQRYVLTPILSIPSSEQCARLLAYTEWHDAQIQLAMADLTSRPPYHDQLDYRERQAGAEKAARERLAKLTVAEVEKGLGVAEAAVKRRPEDWMLRHICAQLYQALGRPEGAVEHLEAMVKMYPDVESFRMMLERARGMARTQRQK